MNGARIGRTTTEITSIPATPTENAAGIGIWTRALLLAVLASPRANPPSLDEHL